MEMGCRTSHRSLKHSSCFYKYLKQCKTNILWNYGEEMSYLRSVSGTLDVMEELVEVRVVTDGGRTGNDSPESHFSCI
jgi:hypothetical protein